MTPGATPERPQGPPGEAVHGSADWGHEPPQPRERRARARSVHVHHVEPLHTRMTRVLGADMRLLYGFAIPMAGVIAFIIALAVSGQAWMIGGVIVFMLIALAVVVFGLYEMLGEDGDEEPPPRRR